MEPLDPDGENGPMAPTVIWNWIVMECQVQSISNDDTCIGTASLGHQRQYHDR